jgi:hypothetical protein
VTVGHGQEVGEGMTIPTGMESVGNLTTACVVFSGNYLLPLSPHLLTRAMTQVIHTKSRAMRHTINSLGAGHKTTHQIMTTSTRRAFKPKSVWSLVNPVPASSSWAWILTFWRRMFVDAFYIFSSTELNLCYTLAAGIPFQQWMQH